MVTAATRPRAKVHAYYSEMVPASGKHVAKYQCSHRDLHISILASQPRDFIDLHDFRMAVYRNCSQSSPLSPV